jgi:tRNA threonylcarbamoyladenosine biosynthesis protein TsaB
MNILALDTSMQACSVAVVATKQKAQMFTAYEEIGRGHAERLMVMIDEVLANAGIPIRQIDQFAVSRGPGTFTGVRIGIAAARGLALACKKPLVGICTLQVLAKKVLFECPELVSEGQLDLGITVDARRGEIYWQLFDMKGQALGEAMALSPQAVATLVKKRHKPVMLAGSGNNLIARLLDKETDLFSCTHTDLQPDAARLVDIVITMKKNNISSQHRVSPLYLRPADAKIQKGYAIERQS